MNARQGLADIFHRLLPEHRVHRRPDDIFRILHVMHQRHRVVGNKHALVIRGIVVRDLYLRLQNAAHDELHSVHRDLFILRRNLAE